ncbi:MAG: tRNA pseudouridine(38-40) synthase TruA [Flavobacteriales bacterium]|nr:tRNA pseudouridine(38-40) synthase TruA [Flavobacteriales bacterium]
MRYFTEISYKGTQYSGWQIQENANTVQAEFNKALSVLLKTETDSMGCGRTDAGVHALGMVAHFDAAKELEADFLYKLNALLPKDISIREIRAVKSEAHARFDAISRSYRYLIHDHKDPFSNHDSYFFNKALDLEAIDRAVEIIKNQKDFEAFSKVHTEVNHFNCDIFEAKWERSETGHVFHIRADRFLRGMVRTIVGTLLDVGEGKTSPDQVKEILESKDRKLAGRSVPAHGLYILKADYPNEIYLN